MEPNPDSPFQYGKNWKDLPDQNPNQNPPPPLPPKPKAFTTNLHP